MGIFRTTVGGLSYTPYMAGLPEGLVVTKHGRPVARVIPFERGSSALIGSLEGKIEVLGDVLSTGAKWDADR